MKLTNKVVLVTGAAKGIGKAIVQALAENGAVVYAGAKDSSVVTEWKSLLPAEIADNIVPTVLDVSDAENCKNVITAIRKDQGRIDALVNNAGIVRYELLAMLDFEKMREMFEVNVYAPIRLLQLCSRIMAKQNSGSIINIGSIVAEVGVSGQLAYAASKGALISASKCAAKELANAQVRVNVVSPGMIATERLEREMEGKFADKASNIGMKRLGNPEEVAAACVFLVSDDSSYITGQVLGINGSIAL